MSDNAICRECGRKPDEPHIEWCSAESDAFWLPIVAPDGEWDMEQVKRELHDYKMLLDNVPKVYDHATNGRVSKPNTLASAVIGELDAVRDEDIAEAVKVALFDDRAVPSPEPSGDPE